MCGTCHEDDSTVPHADDNLLCVQLFTAEHIGFLAMPLQCNVTQTKKKDRRDLHGYESPTTCPPFSYFAVNVGLTIGVKRVFMLSPSNRPQMLQVFTLLACVESWFT